ncbi:MAG: hypothetical protein WD063_10450 [Pirellulales bacterium]
MIGIAIDRALRPGCFFLAPPGRLRIERVAEEEVRWEIFRGHLVEAAFARASERFAAWHVYVDSDETPGAAPLVSVRWQRERNTIYVTRQILTHGFKAYEDAPGVILTRPVEKWVTELVGSVKPRGIDGGKVAQELGRTLFLAVVGTSRLPITSLESPLPAFSLGRLAYLPIPFYLSDAQQPWSDAVELLAEAIASGRELEEQAKALETALRATSLDSLARIVDFLDETFSRDERSAEWLGWMLRAVFNGVALSPYTHFADALVWLIIALAELEWFGPVEALDTIGYMLRHLSRHLTAFDLTLFHNFGANYPDALFLESLLTAHLGLSARHPEVALDSGRAARLRRRALRQACLVRRQYEGHLVPDAPTSLGENSRVLGEPFPRVPEEQILEPRKRRRKLFAETGTVDLLGPFGGRLLRKSLADLDEPLELRELGMAVFLDRPLGALKEPGEVDRTPLLSYEAFSRSIARRRIGELIAAGWIEEARRVALLAALETLSIQGVPVIELATRERPGVVTIADARKVAADFVLLRTTHSSLSGLFKHLDWRPLPDVSPETHNWLIDDPDALLVQHVAADEPGRPVLRFYRGDRLRLELGLPRASRSTAIYEESQGVEFPDLQILRICDSGGERDFGDQSIWLKRYVDA